MIERPTRNIEKHSAGGKLPGVQAVVGEVQHTGLRSSRQIGAEVAAALRMPAHSLVAPLRGKLRARVIGTPEVQAAAGILLQPFRNAMLIAEDVDRLPQQTGMRLHKESVLPQPPVVLRRSLGQEADAQIRTQL